MAKHTVWDFLNGYEVPLTDEGAKSVTGSRFFSRSVTGSVRKRRRSTLVSGLINLSKGITRILSYTAMKSYGAAFLSYGIVTFLGYLLADYVPFVSLGREYLIVGILCALLAIPFLLSDKPFSIAIQDMRLVSFILFDFFSVKRAHRIDSGYPSIPVPVSIILGIILGAVGYFVELWWVVIGFLALLLIYVTFLSPEFAFFLSLIVLPYLSYIPYSNTVFPALIALTVVSLIRKVIFGKRVLFFEQYEVLIGLMMTAILISGIFLKGMESFTSSLAMISLGMGYILSGNLITNRRLADSTLNSVVISSVPVSLYSTYTLIRAFASGEAASLIGRGISSTFLTTGECAVFLSVAVVFAAALIKQSQGGKRAVYWVIELLDILALVMTGELLAVFALVFCVLAYHAMKTRLLSVPLMLTLSLLPYVILFTVPYVADVILAYVPGIDRVSELESLWRACFDAIGDRPFLGIGIGVDSFVSEMVNYGVNGFIDSSNVFIELALEAGVLTLVCFALMLLVRLRHRANYHAYIKQSQVGVASTFAGVAIFAMLSFGATECLWTAESSFYLFFTVFGMGAATLRAAKKEMDDKVLYYEDARAVDYSAIDIEIR